MSKSKFITLSSSIPIYNVLLDHLENLLDKNNKDHYCPIPELRSAIKKGYEKLQIYYSKTDESIVYPIATILDPRIKLKYYKQQEWEEEYINKAIKIIKKQYNENYQDDSFNNDLRAQKTDLNNFFSLFEMGDDNDSSNEDELEEYLRKPAVNFKTDPLQWWKAHEATYPHLAKMARDYLAIPGTSVPVERIFSDTEDDETVQKEVTNKNDLEKSSQPQPTMPPKNQQKTTKTANTRIGVDEIDNDEEAVSNLVKLNDKKATKNVSGAVAGLNTNSTPVALNNIGNMFEIDIWLSNNPHILQVANQLCAMRNMSPQSFDNEITSKTLTVLTASSHFDYKGSARLWRVTLNDLEIEDFIDEAVANKVFSRFLAATNRRLFNKNGNMEILVGLLQSAFIASFNKCDIKAIKALDAITCNMQVFSKSGRNIAMNLELY
ncbi:unnamed protein product [Rhizophagus irregularis]|nr:unnamed protein product [Rhizophagus irregularis]